MTESTVTIFAFVALLLLLISGMPIALVLGLVGVAGIFLLNGASGLTAIGGITFTTIHIFVLVAIPLFVLMGELIFTSGVGGDLYEVGSKWFGRLPGGLAMGSTAACGVFGAMCGLGAAGVAAIGGTAIPEMRNRGYSESLATGSVGAAGALAILIPPSVPAIIYASVMGISVGALFMACMIPGIVLVLVMMACIGILVVARPEIAPLGAKVRWKERFISLGKISPPLLLVVLVLGSLYLGICSPSEAAGVGAAGAVIITGLVYRKLTWSRAREALVSTVRIVGFILPIMVGAMLFGVLVTLLHIPDAITAFVSEAGLSKYVLLVIVNVLLIFAGMFLEIVSIILLFVPLFVPPLVAVGFSPILIGVILLINMEMALITPPVGMNLFIIYGIAPDVPLSSIIRGILPFVVCEVIVIILVVLFPNLALWLPGMMIT